MFRLTKFEGSNHSSNDLEADLLWEDLENSEGEEDVGGTPKEKTEYAQSTAYEFEWHPYGSQEVGVGQMWFEICADKGT